MSLLVLSDSAGLSQALISLLGVCITMHITTVWLVKLFKIDILIYCQETLILENTFPLIWSLKLFFSPALWIKIPLEKVGWTGACICSALGRSGRFSNSLLLADLIKSSNVAPAGLHAFYTLECFHCNSTLTLIFYATTGVIIWEDMSRGPAVGW